MEPIIQTNRLTKQYPNGRGCFHVSLSIQEGSIFGLLGPNGAGKSTIIKTLVGLMRPTEGEAYIKGFPIGTSQAKKQIGYLPELFRFQEWLTPKEILQFHGYLHTNRHSFVRSASFMA
ncbi:MAG TPA: ATP-binding cassette domain-containing protein, partial [Bacillales bacterium]|nr:ATP-binding cassette domain-containing protein [Bacillales bacterium]